MTDKPDDAAPRMSTMEVSMPPNLAHEAGILATEMNQHVTPEAQEVFAGASEALVATECICGPIALIGMLGQVIGKRLVDLTAETGMPRDQVQRLMLASIVAGMQVGEYLKAAERPDRLN